MIPRLRYTLRWGGEPSKGEDGEEKDTDVCEGEAEDEEEMETVLCDSQGEGT